MQVSCVGTTNSDQRGFVLAFYKGCPLFLQQLQKQCNTLFMCCQEVLKISVLKISAITAIFA
jgi:hypothetical protein